METVTIKNIADLRGEILRLKGLKEEQRIALAARFSSPSALIATAFSLFPKSPTVDGIRNSGLFNQDFLGLISRVLLPFTLNKTLFRHSNFLVKALVGVISQKASHYISEDVVVSTWDKIKGLFKKTKHETEFDPRIPPNTEAY
jgi:hypothetical protein